MNEQMNKDYQDVTRLNFMSRPPLYRFIGCEDYIDIPTYKRIRPDGYLKYTQPIDQSIAFIDDYGKRHHALSTVYYHETVMCRGVNVPFKAVFRPRILALHVPQDTSGVDQPARRPECSRWDRKSHYTNVSTVAHSVSDSCRHFMFSTMCMHPCLVTIDTASSVQSTCTG